MKSYQYVFFDWDGCLANTLSIWQRSIKATLAEYKISSSDSEVVPLIGDLYNRALALGIKHEQYLDFKRSIYAKVDQSLSDVTLYEGAESILRKLKAEGKKITIISSGSSSSLERMMKQTKVREYFDLIISGSDVENRKPHPEGIEKAIKILSAEKSKTIMIGDSEHDLKAASNAGIDSVLFYPDLHVNFYDLKHLNEAKPTYTIKTFDELGKLIG